MKGSLKNTPHQSAWHACLQIPNKDSDLYCHATLLLDLTNIFAMSGFFRIHLTRPPKFSSLRPDHLFRDYEFVKIFSAQEFQF